MVLFVVSFAYWWISKIYDEITNYNYLQSV